MKKRIRTISMMLPVIAGALGSTVCATADVTGKLNSLNELVLGIITASGVIVLAWGVFEFAMGYQGHDTSQQTVSLKKIVSGLIMISAPQLISLLK